MKRFKGVTLVELVVVIAILLVLVTVVWLVLAPKAKEGGIRARITADLRQIVAAINVYQGDNDDRLPRGFSDLPASTPQFFDNWPKTEAYKRLSVGSYFYTYPAHTQERVARYPFEVTFDPDKFPIVVAEFFAPRETVVEPCWDRWRGQPRALVPNCKLDWILSGFIDGRVTWTKQRDDWNREAAHWNMKP